MKKLLAILLAVCVSFGCVACGGGDEEKIDANKTQIYVSHFNGGFGSEWINEMKTQFEAAYANVSFEADKVGVQVVVKNHKNLASKLDITADDAYVFFNEDTPYKELKDTNKLLDITDVVNGTFDINDVEGHANTPDIADKNIISKFNDLQVAALNLGSQTAPEYYAVPHYEGFYGFTYDADLFDEKGYYMFNNGDFGAYSDSEDLSTGPDGLEGTYDDGLPNTYDDFFRLCDTIQQDGNVPMIFSGDYQFYITNAINALITDYNGYANEQLFYNFNGTTDKYVTGFDGDTPILGSKTITNANGYEVFRQAGYYYGFDFLYRLINGQGGEYLYKSCFTDGYSHTSAQNTFLLSARTNQEDIAILADGTWWQNEADGTFRTMESNYPNSSRATRNLKFMPLPKATSAEVGKGLTLLESQKSYIMVRKTMPAEYIPLVKLFIQFCNTDASLQAFSVLGNTSRALKYEMSQENYDKLTPYGKSLLDMKNDENTKVIYQLSTNPLYASNMSKFKKHESLGYGSYAYVSKAMDENSNLTAKTVFNGLADSWKNRWNDDFGAWID